MEVVQTVQAKKRRTTSKIVDRNATHPAFEHKLSFYSIPPTEEINIEEFETFALDRFRVLKEIENAKTKGLKEKEFNDHMQKIISKYLPLNDYEDIRKDVISHFVLRLAYCRLADRSWFVSQEAALLRFRLKQLKPNEIENFLKDNHLDYFSATPEEIQDISEFLSSKANIFKVPWEQALELVRQRRVVLKKGFAFVPEEDFASILIGRFRLFLADALATAFKVHSHLGSHFDSIAPILNNITTMYVPSDFKLDFSKKAQGKIDLSQIDMLAKRSFPLCMKNLHEKLRESHHLKHMGRMQYGLFLKGIGVTLEDALTFWRSEFSKIMGVEKFEKSYSYNIRHNYGKEGRRADYTPYSCIKIITGVVNPGEHHGCPFKHFDAEHLRAKLAAQGVAESGIRELISLIQGGHYQIACRKHFELTHPSSANSDLVINHPNQYFEESEKFFSLNNGNVKKEEKQM